MQTIKSSYKYFFLFLAFVAPNAKPSSCQDEPQLCSTLSFLVPLAGMAYNCDDGFKTCAKSTFHSVSIYWRPEGASADQSATVKYRKLGAGTWNSGQDLWYAGGGEYRGSIVHLVPGEKWELQLKLPGQAPENLIAETWSEDFPIKKTITVSESSEQTLETVEGGSPGGYILYQASPGVVLDAKKRHDNNIVIKHNYVIINGFTLKGAAKQAIYCEHCSDVIIEENVISDWGERRNARFGKAQGAIQIDGGVRLVIQRNLIQDPSYDTNSWCEDGHPEGPHGIEINNSNGNLVVRYNTITSSKAGSDGTPNYFGDGITGRPNDSLTGFPNRDSDIYGNRIERVWDNPIEAEGGNRNVRVWGNYTDHSYSHIGITPTRLGPLYIWRNVARATSKGPGDDSCSRNGRFIKAGGQSVGKTFIYHNTVAIPPTPLRGATVGISTQASDGGAANILSLNNILQVEAPDQESIDDDNSAANLYDFDLFNGEIPEGSEPNGIFGKPVYLNDQGEESYFGARSLFKF